MKRWLVYAALACLISLAVSTPTAAQYRYRYDPLRWSDLWPLIVPGLAIDIDATSIRFDPTEITGGTTWDDGGEASVIWQWNLTAGDPAFTFGNGIINVSTGALQEAGNAVPNATDHLGFFAATTSAQLYGVVSDETGSASGAPLAVFSVNPTLTGATLAGILADNDDMVFEVDANNDGANKYSFTDGAGVEVGSLTEAGVFAVTGNVSGATYGSDSSITDAELLTLDDGALTQILVGGGAGSAPVWGTDIPTAVTIGAAYIYRAGGTDVPFTDGGTGLSSWTQYLIPYAATTTSIGQIAIGTAGQPLLSGGAGAAPAFGSDLATATTIGSAYIYRAAGTDVPVTDGGTGVSTLTTAYGLLAAGTTATGTVQTLAAGATTEILVGAGAAALPAWTTATGTGAPVRAGSPTLTTPIAATVYGSADPNGDLTLEGTSSATKTTSYVILQPTSGNVGIGTTGPGSKLHIQDITGNTQIGGSGLITLGGKASGSVVGERLEVNFKSYNNFSKSHASIGAITTSVADFETADLYFATKSGTADAYPTEVMRITSTGPVGIGTTGPSANLTVSGLEGATGTINIWADDGDDAADKTSLTVGTDGILSIQNGVDQIGVATVANGGRLDVQCLSETLTVAADANAVASVTISIPAGATVEGITWRVTQAPGGGCTNWNMYLTGDADKDTLADNIVVTVNTTGETFANGDDTYTAPFRANKSSAKTLTIETTNGSDVLTDVTGASLTVRVHCWVKKRTAPTS